MRPVVSASKAQVKPGTQRITVAPCFRGVSGRQRNSRIEGISRETMSIRWCPPRVRPGLAYPPISYRDMEASTRFHHLTSRQFDSESCLPLAVGSTTRAQLRLFCASAKGHRLNHGATPRGQHFIDAVRVPAPLLTLVGTLCAEDPANPTQPVDQAHRQTKQPDNTTSTKDRRQRR